MVKSTHTVGLVIPPPAFLLAAGANITAEPKANIQTRFVASLSKFGRGIVALEVIEG